MPNFTPKFPSFLGFGKETTPGTGVVPTTYIPVTQMDPTPTPNYVDDTAMRGSMVDAYDSVPTQQWATYAIGGPAYFDTAGLLLKWILGADAVTGTGPYTHVFSLLNTPPGQPDTYSLTDFNGIQAKRYAYGVCSQLEFQFGADALLTWSATVTTAAPTNVSTPTKSYGTKHAQAAYKTVPSIGGTASTRTRAATVTITRAVSVVPKLNSGLDIIAGALSVGGSVTNHLTDDSDQAALTAGTQQAIDLTLTDPVTSDSLDLHMGSVLFTGGPVGRGSDWIEQVLALKPVANTGDAGASGGYSPIKATLVNSTATY